MVIDVTYMSLAVDHRGESAILATHAASGTDVMNDLSPDETFEFQLSGEGISIKRSIRPEIARAILNLVMGGVAAYASTPSAGVAGSRNTAGVEEPGAGRSQERLSLREHMDGCEASRNPDKITAIGHYLIEFEGAPDFGREDVKSRFRAAGEAPPANYPRDFAWAVRSGWVAEDTNAPGRFYVTQKGRSAIAAKFSPDVRKTSPQAKGKRGKRRGGAGEYGAEPV
jgi:hypothetical protein